MIDKPVPTPEATTTHATRFVVRTPLLPVDAFAAWGDGLLAPAACSDADLPTAVAQDRIMLRDRMRETLADGKVREAIYLAAPGLLDGVERWCRDPESKAGQDIERSLVRYLTRMSCRATPFGLFSGLSLGRIDDDVRATLGPITAARRRVELDADTLYAVAAACANAPEVWARGRLFPNTSLTLWDGAFRYTESVVDGQGLSYRLVSAAASDVLLQVVRRAEGGARVADLVDTVCAAEPEVDEEEALAFVRQLVENDLLQSELRPCVTGERPAVAVIGALRACDHPAGVVLENIEARMRALDDVELGVPVSTYAAAAFELRTVHGNEGTRCFHGHLHKHDDELRLDRATLDTVVRTAETLLLVDPMADTLAAFKDQFIERYGDGERWIPLCEVLDDERGLGFGAVPRDASPLIEGVPLAGVAQPAARASVDLIRLALWQRALDGHHHEIDVGREELTSLTNADKLPPPSGRQALAVCFSLARRASDGGVEIIFRWANGPSGARILGRFAHGHPELDELVREHIAAEEGADGEVVFAEIAHVPEGRLVNVVARPLLRRYEIPCLGRSGAPREQQLPLTDLEVTVSGGRIHLRSRSLGKLVAPRLSTAHNVRTTAISAYRFLSALQMQDAGISATWSWGNLAHVARFLPRLRIDGVVVAVARWRFEPAELTDLRSARTPAARFASARRLREDRRLPRHVQYGSGDQWLVVDLDNTLSIDAFVHKLSKHGPLELHEWYPAPTDHFVRGPEGAYEAEYCVPIVRIPSRPAPPASKPPSITATRRVFPPGSSWSYFKLYGGAAATEHALLTGFGPLLESFEAEGAVDRWFFIRFADPRWHLRLRVHGDPATLRGRVEPAILAEAERLRAAGVLWKIDLATYVREAQRYGGDAAVEHAESIFAVDSRASVRLLRLIGGDHETRWMATLLGMDDVVRVMGLDLDRGLDLMTRVAEVRLALLDPRMTAVDAIARRYRQLRAQVERGLARDLPPAVAEVLDDRARELARPAAAFRGLAERGVLTHPLDTIVGDLLHMHANRMLRSDANAQECVLYEFLRRSYRSTAARARSAAKVAAGA